MRLFCKQLIGKDSQMIIKAKEISSINELSQVNNYQKVMLSNQHTTVSKGFLAESVKFMRDQQTTVDALIRPNLNDYHYNDLEIKIMETDIFEAQALGIDGVAIGAATAKQELDTDTLEQLIGAAYGMQVILNHVFDELNFTNQKKAIDFANEHGIDAIMVTANFDSEQAIQNLKELVEYNQGSVQFILTGTEIHRLEAMCNELGIHELMLEN